MTFLESQLESNWKIMQWIDKKRVREKSGNSALENYAHEK